MPKPILKLTTTRPTTKKTPQPPNHIPALNPLELEAALQRLVATEQLPHAAREQVAAMLKAASTSGSDGAEAATRTLSEARQQAVRRGERAMRKQTAGVVARGKARLLAMDDDEWGEMVNDAND
jgi:thioesterase domain-containing protein